MSVRMSKVPKTGSHSSVWTQEDTAHSSSNGRVVSCMQAHPGEVTRISCKEWTMYFFPDNVGQQYFERERERQRDRQTDRQRHRDKDKDRQTETDRDSETERETETETEKRRRKRKKE